MDTTSAQISETKFADALSERYLAYALSTIMSRSLPDVRDGLKPVHRRLLFAMRQLRLAPDDAFKKSARVVGDVMGKFHPHGDTAIYDAMVRLAQDFSQRYPLVDGQGNFGNIDGDNAAAMRYTEARLTSVAESLLQGIDEDAVDFKNTYDGEGNEPLVLPAAFPNLLAIISGLDCNLLSLSFVLRTAWLGSFASPEDVKTLYDINICCRLSFISWSEAESNHIKRKKAIIAVTKSA